MKILLLNPVAEKHGRMLRAERCQIKAVSLWPPVALCYCASMLRDNGFPNVEIFDAEAECLSYHAMIQKVISIDPTVLIIQDTTPTIYSDINIVTICKKTIPNLISVFIGLHSTVCADDVLNGGIDFVVRNEPEYTLLELMQHITNNNDFDCINGLSYKKNNNVIHNQSREMIENLDQLPLPARDLINNDLYRNPLTNKPFTLVKTSRGCPFKCIYCTAQPYYGKKWRSRSVDDVINELKEIVNVYGIKDILFHSDTFNLDKRFVLELCKRIKNENLDIAWMSNCRVDLFDDEIASAMKSSGSYMISFGIESGVQEILDSMNKGITLEQIKNAIKLCKKYKLKCISYFVFGLPGETEETINRTIDFAIKLDADVAQFFIATPFPGTQFYKIAEQEGWLTTKDWSQYLHGLSNVISYPHLNADVLVAKKNEAYRSFYFRPCKILSSILKTRSLGEFMNYVKGFIGFYKSRVAK